MAGEQGPSQSVASKAAVEGSEISSQVKDARGSDEPLPNFAAAESGELSYVAGIHVHLLLVQALCIDCGLVDEI